MASHSCRLALRVVLWSALVGSVGAGSVASAAAIIINHDYDPLEKQVELATDLTLDSGLTAITQQTGFRFVIDDAALKRLGIDRRRAIVMSQKKELGFEALSRLLTAVDGGKSLCALRHEVGGKPALLITEYQEANLKDVVLLPRTKLAKP